MRVIGDYATFDILQVEKTPEVGEFNPFNGRFAIPVPDGASLTVTPASYILPQDGGDVAAQCAAGLLAQFPMYDNVAYNFLLEDADVADLDTSPLPPVSTIAGFTVRTRAQFGRGVGPNPGMWPNMAAIFPANTRIAPVRPGMLVTDTIDIGPATSGAGADEVMVWWHLFEFDTSHDVMSDFGGTSGQDTPAMKDIAETDQEANISVYVSNDDGVTWIGPVGRMEPTDLFVFNTLVRVAFVNTTASTKLYLAGYAVLF